MSAETAYLSLMLDAPLMSFGHASRFQRRTTALHPTRSALLGMICAAAGAPKGSAVEAEWLGRLDEHHMALTVFAIPRRPDGSAKDLPMRRLEDYHTTGGGFDKRTHSQWIPRKASGSTSDNATLSTRQFLMDARFGVVFAGPRATLEETQTALVDPRWGIWFGRKSCIPAAPVVRGVSDTWASAMAALGLEGRQVGEFNAVSEARTFAEGTDTLLDAPTNFATRDFRPRRITVQPAEA